MDHPHTGLKVSPMIVPIEGLHEKSVPEHFFFLDSNCPDASLVSTINLPISLLVSNSLLYI